MRRSLSVMVAVVVVAFVGFAALAACVGDDPEASGGGSSSGATSSGGSSGGSSSGASSSDGGSSSGASSSGGSSGSTGTDGGDASTPFDVRSLTGLKLWLESTKELISGNPTFVSWADQSGTWDAGGASAPDGGRHIAYPFNVNPPVIVSNGINGRPVVSFVDGNGYLSIANHADFQFGVGDWIIVAVAKVSGGSGMLWELKPTPTAGTEEQLYKSHVCVAYGLNVTDGCTSPMASPTIAPHVFVGRRQNDLFTLRVDGTVVSSVDRAGKTTNINISEFGQPYAFIGKGLDLLMSELIIVVGPTDDAKLGTLEDHLKAKYAIP